MKRTERQEEESYLAKTLTFLHQELKILAEDILQQRQGLVEARRDMWENTDHSTRDFDKLIEIVQFLNEVNSQTVGYTNVANIADRYKRLIDSPYFGRFDFNEDGFDLKEKIYIGRANVMDPRTHDVYVYDWRAPISSIFYRFEPGKVSYQTPAGISTGDMTLKRQYKIEHAKLLYFFDSNLRITDELLQEILGQNLSPQMRSIVESIQQEQDQIIRDTDHDVLIVQGTAGSGKTSVALHHIAYLLYDRLHHKLSSNNIMIISPNNIFSQYISGVLPELGEESVMQATFDDMAAQLFGQRFKLTTREDYLETYIHTYETPEGQFNRLCSDFKGSDLFRLILDRWLNYYIHNLLPFADVYFDGKVLENRQQIKNHALSNAIGMPWARHLRRLETTLLKKTHVYKKQRLAKIKPIVAASEGRDFEIHTFSRLLAIKESQALRRRIQAYTRIDYMEIYRRLFSDPRYLPKMAEGLTLPSEINEIIAATFAHLQNAEPLYEDYAPLLYLKLKIEGDEPFPAIRHAVIDEAQDYSPMQYSLFKLLFRHAQFTILGDIHQSIDKQNHTLYDQIDQILQKPKTAKLVMHKSYRSTVEINEFSQKIIGRNHDVLPFARNGQRPQIIRCASGQVLDQHLINDIQKYQKLGYQMIAILCKTQQQAGQVFLRLQHALPVSLVQPHAKDFKKGVIIITPYMAKGLEFDAVLVYNADREHYHTELDRRLLYICCTRALHILNLYTTKESSDFLPSGGC